MLSDLSEGSPAGFGKLTCGDEQPCWANTARLLQPAGPGWARLHHGELRDLERTLEVFKFPKQHAITSSAVGRHDDPLHRCRELGHRSWWLCDSPDVPQQNLNIVSAWFGNARCASEAALCLADWSLSGRWQTYLKTFGDLFSSQVCS